jgi:hypothetical protein
VLSGAVLIALSLLGCSSGGVSSTPKGGTTSTSSSKGADAASAPKQAADLGIPDDCPTVAAVSAALGIDAPTPKVTKDADGLTCLYLSSTENSAIVMFKRAPKGTTADTLKASAAKTEDARVTPVSGIGDAAFDIADTDTAGQARAGIVVLSGSTELFVVGGFSSQAAEGFARSLLH